ncbi:acyltransferase [Burkholderia multivorans]|uniref:acyltransferase family protein n=1 Tax=Burkholderia multivorans TaxID=87883 RepID=UPI0009E0C855|nr:acyltransferase [Burkholderia multivorans]MCO1435460.1 acyltransferase [Burkholderia multivorans]UQN59163.1 acyltransferase [Burkholderia multivorans]UQN67521.1 acyltransferase [Burkholderia multivorans]UQO04914.1 acyltransferase [Burkholderia multivorans]UQO04973.1 acyltransferase [Burkholderia multivorans]
MKKELPALTSFRFIAAIAVVVPHFGYKTDTGGIAVGFFFALSGFILAYNYADRFETLTVPTVAKLWALRVARIWPLHLLMLAAVVPLIWIHGTQYTDWQTLANVFLLHAWYPDGVNIFSYNGVSWSISDELFFYICLPFLLFAFNRLGVSKSATHAALAGLAAFGCLFLIALALRTKMQAFSVDWWLMMVSPYVRIFDFIIGLCLGLLFNSLQGPREKWFDVPLFTVLEIASLWFLVVLYQSTWHKWPTLANSAYYQPAMAAIIFVFAFQRGLLSKVLSNRVLVHLGEISFALYMIHQPIMYYADHFIGPTIMIAKDIEHIWGQVLLSVLMFALADCVYRYIEMPARNGVRAMVSSQRTAADAGFSARGAHE